MFATQRSFVYGPAHQTFLIGAIRLESPFFPWTALHRHGHFDGVETHPSRNITIEIRMMHHMKTPEHSYRMKYHVLKIKDEVQHDDENYFEPQWPAHAV